MVYNKNSKTWRSPTEAGASKLYGPEKFAYDESSDTYTCPRGERLYPRSPDKIRMEIEYVVRKGTLSSISPLFRLHARRGGHSFVDEFLPPAAQSANQHGFKKSRWRRIWCQRIQDHMIFAIQNLKIQLASGGKGRADAKACSIVRVGLFFVILLLLIAIGRLKVRPSPIA